MTARRQLFRNVLLLFVFLIAAKSSLHAQGLSGIWGVITDQTGGVIPGVVVSASNVDTGASRSTITDETGTYIVPQLQPGDYFLRAERPGFKAKIENGVTLPVNETVTLNLTLEL